MEVFEFFDLAKKKAKRADSSHLTFSQEVPQAIDVTGGGRREACRRW